ncbi:LacI family transcriptional regulator [Evansella vedderi]|uniref:LacI family transcriptional regulator n=1 Tax=Evansella vedderi TaxID=38282 RepID=A0ABT9ZNY2_9BACI|nr:LacI family DNA-binding transcriptional regulator [Evansella vedderi]MDQ0252947.1 LacI family transcriptional regulator [Evansella vedderi]
MTITIKDIANKANVSITTVSRVLNNKKGGIGDETRKRILKIIEELDYSPDSIARSMKTKKTKSIGLIIPDIRNPYFPELVRGVEEVANKCKYNVLLYNTDGNKNKELESLRLIKENKVDGIIFTSSNPGTFNENNKYFIEKDSPIIFIDREPEIESYSGLFLNNEKAGYIATKHLIDLNHKNIGCITGPKQIQNSQQRLTGYKKALNDAGVDVNEDIILNGDYQMQGGYEAAKRLIENKAVTAIFALNDLMAFGVYKAAQEFDVQIPKELSVVGFDNLSFNELLTPKLTTIDQNVSNMGKVAAKLLLKKLGSGGGMQNKSIYLDPKLIIRESTTFYKIASSSFKLRRSKNFEKTSNI